MTKSILELLSSKDKPNKTEIERTQDYISYSIDIRISDMKAFVDIYKELGFKNREKIADSLIWELIMKIDEIEDLNNMFEQLNSDESAEKISNYLGHLNNKNIYNYDDSIEEIYSELRAKEKSH